MSSYSVETVLRLFFEEEKTILHSFGGEKNVWDFDHNEELFIFGCFPESNPLSFVHYSHPLLKPSINFHRRFLYSSDFLYMCEVKNGTFTFKVVKSRLSAVMIQSRFLSFLTPLYQKELLPDELRLFYKTNRLRSLFAEPNTRL